MKEEVGRKVGWRKEGRCGKEMIQEMSGHNELKGRTKKFALAVIQLVQSLPPGRSGEVLGKQLLRSATSLGANYRSACRARSNAEFISRITIVEEEADESMYWLELLTDAGIVRGTTISALMKEADELTAIFTTAGKTAKRKKRNKCPVPEIS